MAKMLDFNKFDQPTLPLVMRDDAKTKLTVVAPSEELIERLEANIDGIKLACASKNSESLVACYDLTAELISCNEEGIKMTGKELKEVYKVNYMMLFAFLVSYLEFVNEIKSAKN